MLISLFKYLVVEATGSEWTDNAVCKRQAETRTFWLHTSAVAKLPNSCLTGDQKGIALFIITSTAWLRRCGRWWQWPVSCIREAEMLNVRRNISLEKRNEIR
jgi:hypothetical protein